MKTLLAALALTAVGVSPALAQTYTNPNTITVVDGGETTSDINVTGSLGNITGMTLSLNGLSHTYPDDLVFGVLNQSLGLGFVFFSGAGGSTDISGVNLTFSDAASSQLPESFVGGAITSGTYLPSNYGQYEFSFFDNATAFADFSGFSANGLWTLYVDDVFPADGGTVLDGWTLTFTTDGVGGVPEPAAWGMMIGGFALAGFALRRRQKVSVAYAA
ncbi:PEPxxWA-CTERM sorting domain-containing protein [Sphingomonas sp. JC676]|uniref:PEPxxWA-CTERM sorting domain-containing protein n=1 Tax=Sphingomonas sp. JC676 TaxID=2768065 RepID=UPI001657EDD3|nr:PEPxxWA-CTERM sorting domain-containing protein [Sphingomonas sp. JC676]MBC9034693.1 PEPxxWA-CTERM sorting domain-containing protein [Sphingomonas sp. JC676]